MITLLVEITCGFYDFKVKSFKCAQRKLKTFQKLKSDVFIKQMLSKWISIDSSLNALQLCF